MSAKPEVSERASMSLQRQRESQALNLLGNDGDYDIALLSQEDFDAGLKLERVRQERIKQIILNDLILGIDFGKVTGVEKPFPWEGTADKLLKRLRWSAEIVGEPHIMLTEEYLLVTVMVGIFSMGGRLLHKIARSCSTKEKRFKKKGGSWKYDTPAECLNECIAMGFKRGKIAGTLSAAAAKGYFSNPEQLEDGDEANQPWTDEQKAEFIGQAKAAGVKTAEAMNKLVGGVTGYDQDGDALSVLQSHIGPLNEALAKLASKPAGTPGPPKPAQAELGDAAE